MILWDSMRFYEILFWLLIIVAERNGWGNHKYGAYPPPVASFPSQRSIFKVENTLLHKNFNQNRKLNMFKYIIIRLAAKLSMSESEQLHYIDYTRADLIRRNGKKCTSTWTGLVSSAAPTTPTSTAVGVIRTILESLITVIEVTVKSN